VSVLTAAPTAPAAPRPARPAPHLALRFRPDVEGLRALAVLLVLADHLVGAPSGGFVGVDVFFVLSGFLITGLLLREAETTGRVDLLAFYLRRTRRIVPAALLVVVVTVVASALVLHRVGALRVLGDGVASVLMVQNWHLVRLGVSYFGGDGTGSPLLHYWSLAVEEQFYVLWPWLFVVWAWSRRRSRRRAPAGSTTPRPGSGRGVLLVVVLAATAASFGASVAETELRQGWAYFSFQSRAWELGVGAAVAVAAPALARAGRAGRTVLWSGGLLAIVASAVLVGPEHAFPGVAALPVVLGTAALLASGGASGGRRLAPVVLLDNPPMRWLGRVSYSLYLWHLPVFVLLSAVWPGRGLAVAGLSATLSVGLAALTHRFVEQPLRRGAVGRRGRSAEPRAESRAESRAEARTEARRRSHGLLAGATVAVAVLALSAVQLLGPATVPLPTRAPAERAAAVPFPDEAALRTAVREAADSAGWPALSPSPDDVSPADGAAASAGPGCLVDPVGASPRSVAEAAAACTTGAEHAERTAVVLGDSIATSWLPGITGALVPEGWRVVGQGLQSCPAVDVRTTDRLERASFADDCAAARDAAVERVVAEAPDLVVLSSSLGAYQRLTGRGDEADAAGAWREGTARTAAELAATGATVVVLSSPPESAPAAECAVRPRGPETCLGTPSRAWLDKTAAEQEAVAGLADGSTPGAPLRARFLDTAPWTCTDELRCPAFVGDALVKVDAGHLAERWSASLALVLREALLDAAGDAR